MQRRVLLKLLAGLALGPGLPFSASAQALSYTVIGFTQSGLPLVVHHLGGGARPVLVLGGQHGGPEYNTVELAEGLLAHFRAHPERLPADVRLDVLVVANPDGVGTGSRQFLSGVDPNRNWANPDWQTDAYDSNGQFRRGLGGPHPFSEQETRALRDWVLQSRPIFTANYHSAGGFMFGPQDGLGGELATAYEQASGYYRPQASGGSGPRLLGYRASGSMNPWLRDQGLNAIFVELTSPWAAEFERNLAGLQAVLARLALAGPTL